MIPGDPRLFPSLPTRDFFLLMHEDGLIRKHLMNNRMFPKIWGTPKSSILIGFSFINHPFWGTPIFGNNQQEPFEPQQ